MSRWILALALLGACDDNGDGDVTPTDSAPQETETADTGTQIEVLDYSISGLETRPEQGSCVAPMPRPSDADFGLEYVDMFPGIPNTSMSAPTMLSQHPSDDDVFFLIRQGYAWMTSASKSLNVIQKNDQGNWEIEPVFEFDVLTTYLIDDGPDEDDDPDTVVIWEGGVLGMTLHPEFDDGSPYVYVHYTRAYSGDEEGYPFESAIVRLTLDEDYAYVEDSVTDIITLPQPADHHQGGHLMFGQDGYLYASFGDGGLGNEPESQNPETLFGTVIRIDVDGGDPYVIPSDNPFVDNTDGWREEIYAYGLRNPWKFDQNPLDGVIMVADVGESDYEELNILEPGRNYGWPHKEGFECEIDNCDDTVYTDPYVALANQSNGGDFKAIIGGAYYASDEVPEWAGRYFFGSLKAPPQILTLDYDNDGEPLPVSLDDAYSDSVMGIIRLRDGRVVVLDVNRPRLIELAEEVEDTAPEVEFPMYLSDVGCFDEATLEPLDALIPFDVNMPLWSDGAAKKRWMMVPDGETISLDPDGDMVFPAGSMLFKEFSLDGRKLETRMLVHHEDGSWKGYTYKWNEAQTDAELLLSSQVEDVAGVNWLYPSQAQCAGCHQEGAGRSLGPDLRQLNSFITYEAGVKANQLVTLDAIGLLDESLSDSPEFMYRFPALDDDSVPASERARGYMHSNCSHCHNPDGTDRASFDLRADVPFADMSVCDAPAGLTLIDGEEVVVVAPGEPDVSALFHRISTEGDLRMPLMGTEIVHDEWVDVAEQWILDMPDCSGPDADGDGTPDEDDGCPLDASTVNADDCE